MAEKPRDLPQECWELVLNAIDRRHQLSPISLVCKTFLSITDDLAGTLVVTDQTALHLPSLLRRFKRLRAIDFSRFRGDVDDLLSRVAESGLSLESLDVSDRKSLPIRGLTALGSKVKNLTSLNCSKISALRDGDLASIARIFPSLEELDISHPERFRFSDVSDSESPVSDAGVLALSTKLTRLRKINLSGNHFISDKSLDFLSTNCLGLSEIALCSCDFVTQNGVALLISRCTNLNSVSVSRIGSNILNPRLNGSLINVRSLRDVELRSSVILDDILFSMGRASVRLNKLCLVHCYGFTFDGISFLLSKQRSIRSLGLEAVKFLSNESMAELSKFLSGLSWINLSMCHRLTELTFFALTRNCPLLSQINMFGTNIGGKDHTSIAGFVPNKTRIKSLNLGQNRCLDDDCLKNIASICPNLETLDLRNCLSVTEQGISEALKRCPEIKQLDVHHCIGIRSLSLDSVELSKLEVLCASELGIDDYTLGLIGNRCPRMLQLDLSGCLRVTAKGVKEMVKNCRVLREIDLKWCKNVGVDIVAWMVVSRPSLRRIVPPCGYVPSESQRSFFLRHGCHVCDG